jgi:hypothetical protein
MNDNISVCLIKPSSKFRTFTTLLQEGKSGVYNKLLISLRYYLQLLLKIQFIKFTEKSDYNVLLHRSYLMFN